MQHCALLVVRQIKPVAVDFLQLTLVPNALVEVGEKLLIVGEMLKGINGGRGRFFSKRPPRGPLSGGFPLLLPPFLFGGFLPTAAVGGGLLGGPFAPPFPR